MRIDIGSVMVIFIGFISVFYLLHRSKRVVHFEGSGVEPDKKGD